MSIHRPRLSFVLLMLQIAVLVTGCSEAPISISEVHGSYRAALPDGKVTLDVKANGDWEYRVEAAGFHRTGAWELEPALAIPGMLPLGLRKFELGFAQEEPDFRGPVLRLFYFERYRGRIRTCMRNLPAKYSGPSGQLCFDRE